MAKGKRVGAGHKARYTAYKNGKTYETNRRKRLERAKEKNPENEQIAVALKDIHYRRKTPNTRLFGGSKKAIAALFKLFKGKFDSAVFSTNDKVSAPALTAAGKVTKDTFKMPEFKERQMFSIGTRILGAS